MEKQIQNIQDTPAQTANNSPAQNEDNTMNGFAVNSPVECANNERIQKPWADNLKYSILGIIFGIVFVKAEIISWFRIQEMFRFQAFFMYGVIGTAVIVGMISVFLIKKFNIKTFEGETVVLQPKVFKKGQIYGGLIFGMGWALTGACPGPLFAQIGSGFLVVSVSLLSALAGTWVYGYFKEVLPE